MLEAVEELCWLVAECRVVSECRGAPRHDKRYGNSWSEIAKHLPDRSDKNVKNHWHSALRRMDQVRGPPRRHPRGVGPTDDVLLPSNAAFFS